MRSSRRTYPALLVLVLGLLLACAHASYAGDLTYLALQREGQASIAVDEKKKAAFVIDLGRGGDGDQVLLDDLPLLDRLEQRGVEDLHFVCSHPHSDHMGGIRAMFRQPRLFFKDEQRTVPRFKSITVVDDGVSNSLYKELKNALAGNTRIRIGYESAANRNAFANISTAADDVHVETVPYRAAGKPGAHGRAVVTRIRLGQKHTIVDFDDADSAVIRKVVNALKARGETKINTMIAAHHGSRYHELAPVLDELRPDRSIIPVNPRNRYGHPSPPTLRKLMENLGKENVVFTGSSQNVVLDNNGVKSATYTGATRASYALFVAPNRIRAEKRGNTSDVKDCIAIQQMMNEGGGGGDTPPPPDGAGPGRQQPPPRPDRGGGGAGRAVLEGEVRLKGSILQPEFEFGAVSYSRDGIDALKGKKIFAYALGSSADLTGQDVAVVVERPVGVQEATAVTLSPSEAHGALQKLKLLGSNAERARSVRVFFSSPTGLRDLLMPALVLQPQELAALSVATPAPVRPVTPPGPGTRTPRGGRPGGWRTSATTSGPPTELTRTRLPKGGMVFLQGDKLFPVGEATELLGGSLHLCGANYCVRTPGSGAGGVLTYELPFSPGPLFTEVWERVYDERIDSFYLSINPTKNFLRGLNSGFDRIPADRLKSGVGAPGAGIRTHEVVTAGGIEKTQIGQILWEADVAFKSESLGFDVLTGGRGAFGPRRMTRQSSESTMSLTVPYRERWCRLYWTSGSQQIEVDAASNGVRFTGDAVTARAEPMVMRRGELVDEPRGTWCGDSKSVAASLQRQANSGRAGLPVLNRLKQLAEIQSFVRWARDNGITPAEDFRHSVEQHKAAPGYDVPNWTSGIKSDPRVRVQQQVSRRGDAYSSVIHVSLAEMSTLTNCVMPYWNAQDRDFPQYGIRQERGIWQLKPGDYQFVDNWMATLAANIATCSNGELLQPMSAGSLADVTAPRPGRKTELAIDLHVQPVHMHGGVLLGMQRGFLKSAVQEKGLLLSWNHRPYFQKADGKLHFWNYTDAHPRFGSSGQHVVINDGSVKDVRALEGLLRFEVETKPGAVILQESRWGRAGTYAKGVEWAGARHASDGSWIREDAAWPCADSEGGGGGPACVRTDEVTLADLRAKIGGNKPGDSAIIVTRIDENRWRVVLDASSVRSQLDEHWETLPSSSVNARLSLVYEYAKWGFVLEALEKYAEVADKIEGDTVDTILRKILEAPLQDN